MKNASSEGVRDWVRAPRGRAVIINPNETELDDAADAVLRGPSAVLLPRVLQED